MYQFNIVYYLTCCLGVRTSQLLCNSYTLGNALGPRLCDVILIKKYIAEWFLIFSLHSVLYTVRRSSEKKSNHRAAELHGTSPTPGVARPCLAIMLELAPSCSRKPVATLLLLSPAGPNTALICSVMTPRVVAMRLYVSIQIGQNQA